MDTGGPNVMNPDCPSRDVLALACDKWTILVLNALANGPSRFSVVRADVRPITPKALTNTLRCLERDGLVTRTHHLEIPPRVDYELTELGHSMLRALRPLRAWAEAHTHDIVAAREEHDQRAAGQ